MRTTGGDAPAAIAATVPCAAGVGDAVGNEFGSSFGNGLGNDLGIFS